MGIFSGLMGNACEVKIEELEKNYQNLLFDGETIECGYKVIRDTFMFTSKRLILIDIQGMTGKKVEYHSIPYKSITHFCIESSGHLDLDAELKIWISGTPEPIQKQFNKSIDIYALQAILAGYILNK